MTFRDNLAVLGERNFGWYFWSRFVNIAGSTMSSVALAFAILKVSDSASALGYVMAAHTIPMVVFLLLGGVVADRFPRAVILQLSNVLSALTQGVAAYLVISGHAHIWELVVLEAVNGTTSAASFPAEQGLIPQLVPRESLQQANVLLSLSRGALTVLGPSVSAALVVGVGAGWGLAVDAATWAVAAVLLLPVRIPPRALPAASGTPAGGPPGVVTELREGWTFFRTTTWLWVVVASACVGNAIFSGGGSVLGPKIAADTIGARGWGFAMSAQSVGLILMMLVMLRIPMRRPLALGQVAVAAMGLPLLAQGLAPHHAWPIVVGYVLGGAGMELFGLGWSLAMQENIAEEMMSRASSYDAFGSFVAMPVGELVYGPLGGLVGDQRLQVISGAFFVVLMLLTAAVPAVWGLRRAQPAKPEPGPEAAPVG